MFCLLDPSRIFKKVGSIKRVISKKLPEGAVQSIGTRFDGGIQNSGSGAAKFGTEICGLNAQFLNGVDWRKNHIVRPVQKIHAIGIVVDAVEKVIVLGGPQAIGRERSGRGISERIASRIGLGRVDSRGKLGQERIIPSVQRKVVHTSRIDNLTHRCILSLQLGSICLDLDGFVYGTWLQVEINDNSRADVNNDATQ